MYVYVDILIITNIYVDFLLIKSTSIITHSRLKTLRGIVAAVLGSLFSLVIFLPKIPPLGLTAIKLVSAAAVIFSAFGYESREAYFKRLFVFFITSFIFAGLGSAASSFGGGRVIVSRNGVIYGNFSMPVLIASTIGAYAVIQLYKRVADVSEKGGVYTVTARQGSKTVSFRALADTGNSLRDMITGKPVIIANRSILSELFGYIPNESDLCNIPENPSPGFISGNTSTALKFRQRQQWQQCPKRRRQMWRIIPCKTVSGTALIPICRPDEVAVKNEETGQLRTADVYLGVSPLECEFAVFNPKIL
ncbi:MAG: sigma-E processing peptidase SpoIIGA [Oscillospiraceae bacterium]|nr:sigma-E processing peptidase SpoIIGA [Oscillospiraceae bacterium]